jgi:tight adherence protein C
MVLFFILGVLLLGAGVALLVGALAPGAPAPVDTVGQIEAYGFAAKPPVAAEAGTTPHRSLMSFVARVGWFVQRSLGVGERGIRRDLLAAGMYQTDPLTIVGYRALGLVGLLVVWIWLAVVWGLAIPILVLGAIVAGALGWMLPVVIVRRRGRKRTAQIEYELPELIDVLVVTLEAGLSFLASLSLAADRIEGPLGVELRLTLQEQRMGLGIHDALEGMLRRVETPNLRTFVRSVAQGESLGVSTGQIMRNLAVEMRKRRRSAAEERAQKAPVKMLFPLIFLIFPAMFVILLGPAVYNLGKIFNTGGG